MTENLVNELIQIYKDGMICTLTKDGIKNTYKAFEFLQDKISKQEKIIEQLQKELNTLRTSEEEWLDEALGEQE